MRQIEMAELITTNHAYVKKKTFKNSEIVNGLQTNKYKTRTQLIQWHIAQWDGIVGWYFGFEEKCPGMGNRYPSFVIKQRQRGYSEVNNDEQSP